MAKIQVDQIYQRKYKNFHIRMQVLGLFPANQISH